MKSLTSAGDLSVDDIGRLIDRALSYARALETSASVEPLLGDRVLANLFFEPSTRTRLSFELAAKRLGAHVLTFHSDTSSALKGESLRDTVLTISAIGADVLVVRHSDEGVPARVHEWTGLPVLSAGDGAGEHPTQALLDAVTLTSHFGSLSGLDVAVVGDVGHSRVAGSLVRVLPPLGASVTFIGPAGLLPIEPPDGVRLLTDLDAVLGDFDVLYLLRVQTERGALAGDDYRQKYGLDLRRAASMRPEAVVMHPGPMNRGVEISPDVADGPRSLILSQVRHGVPTRMAVLHEIAGSLP